MSPFPPIQIKKQMGWTHWKKVGGEAEVMQEQAVCPPAEDSEWSINAYNNRSVLHMICRSSALLPCRTGRSTLAQLAKLVATGEQLVELTALGKFSGKFAGAVRASAVRT